MATIKQKKAISKIVENRGNVSRAMIDAGYNLTTAKNPKNLTESKAWEQLADAIPDMLLAERHLELLNKRDTYTYRTGTGKRSKVHQVDLGPEVQAVTKGLDMAYKLKGSYAPEKSTALHVNIERRIEDKSEIEALRQEYEEKLKAKLIQ